MTYVVTDNCIECKLYRLKVPLVQLKTDAKGVGPQIQSHLLEHP